MTKGETVTRRRRWLSADERDKIRLLVSQGSTPADLATRYGISVRQAARYHSEYCGKPAPSRGRRPTFTPAELDAMCERLDAGDSYAEIGAGIGRDRTTVFRAIQSARRKGA